MVVGQFESDPLPGEKLTHYRIRINLATVAADWYNDGASIGADNFSHFGIPQRFPQNKPFVPYARNIRERMAFLCLEMYG